MNQKELIEKLQPTRFDPEKHTLIKAKYEGMCQLCYRNYFPTEWIAFNFEKKKGRHIDCEDFNVKKRKQFKRRFEGNPHTRGKRKGSIS